jgi:hypothetical protein
MNNSISKTNSFLKNKARVREREREKYAIKGGEEVEAGDDEVSESEAIDLLILVRPWQKLVHHLQVSHVPILVEHVSL